MRGTRDAELGHQVTLEQGCRQVVAPGSPRHRRRGSEPRPRSQSKVPRAKRLAASATSLASRHTLPAGRDRRGFRSRRKSMPPMPPPPGMAGTAALGSGFSATVASVVTSRPATVGGILQSHPHDLGRINDAGLDQVAKPTRLGIEAEGHVALVGQLADHDRAVHASVLRDLPDRGPQRAADDLNAEPLVVVGRLETVQGTRGIERCGTTARAMPPRPPPGSRAWRPRPSPGAP